MKNTVLIIFIIILGLIAAVLYKSAESLPRPFEKKADDTMVLDKDTTDPDTKDNKDEDKDTTVFNCEPEQRNVDACIEIFQPVCAEVNVQCITTPCPPIKETFSNSCFACKNSLVDKYTEGECIAK